MKVVCFDLEGVLVPEFWEEFAKIVGIPELMKTTRDEPDYDVLMKMRIAVLKEHHLGMNEVHKIVAEMRPFVGAREFLDWLRTRAQIAILTGSYYDYINPLIGKLGNPFTYANSLVIDNNGVVAGYTLREPDGKSEVVKRFRESGFGTIAVGDSFNDVKMLKEADVGILFKACDALKNQEAEMRRAETFAELKEILTRLV
jgi:phosphoserine / homoserine phosphotransferase